MKTLALFIVSLAAGIWNAWVALCLWGWFAVPAGAPAIALSTAYGLMCLVSVAMIATIVYPEHRAQTHNLPAVLLAKIVYSVVLLACGYVAHCL